MAHVTCWDDRLGARLSTRASPEPREARASPLEARSTARERPSRATGEAEKGAPARLNFNNATAAPRARITLSPLETARDREAAGDARRSTKGNGGVKPAVETSLGGLLQIAVCLRARSNPSLKGTVSTNSVCICNLEGTKRYFLSRPGLVQPSRALPVSGTRGNLELSYYEAVILGSLPFNDPPHRRAV
jgi:hypothetical protein